MIELLYLASQIECGVGYGCNVSANLAKVEFVQVSSQYTEADILASTDLTRSTSLAEDQDLEAKTLFEKEIDNNPEHLLFDSDFSFNSLLNDDKYTNPRLFDLSSPNLSFDDDYTLDIYNPAQFDLDFNFNNVNSVDFYYPNESKSNFNLN